MCTRSRLQFAARPRREKKHLEVDDQRRSLQISPSLPYPQTHAEFVLLAKSYGQQCNNNLQLAQEHSAESCMKTNERTSTYMLVRAFAN